jgi:type I restriction enzyme R subunit
MSNFAFQPPAFKDVAEAFRKAEEHVMSDPRAACFHASFAALQHRAFRGEL